MQNLGVKNVSSSYRSSPGDSNTPELNMVALQNIFGVNQSCSLIGSYNQSGGLPESTMMSR